MELNPHVNQKQALLIETDIDFIVPVFKIQCGVDIVLFNRQHKTTNEVSETQTKLQVAKDTARKKSFN